MRRAEPIECFVPPTGSRGIFLFVYECMDAIGDVYYETETKTAQEKKPGEGTVILGGGSIGFFFIFLLY